MDPSLTIGGFFNTLYEMGFTETQIQAAVKAGHFSVPAAAEWLLQGRDQRCKLGTQPFQPLGTAISAFNPPKKQEIHSSASMSQQAGTAREGASNTENQGTDQPSSSSSEPPPLGSRIKQDKKGFEDQLRDQVAQEVQAEKRMKKKEHELVLKRIADDRRSLQEKSQPSGHSDTSAQQGQRLGGKVQTSMDNHCILMLRLPSGESMRERFPAEASLRSVMQHISERYPSLSSFSLVQGFPRKRFGEAELACSLRALGLTPNAALCIQNTPLEPAETPAETPEASSPDKPEDRPRLPRPPAMSHSWGPGEFLRGMGAGSEQEGGINREAEEPPPSPPQPPTLPSPLLEAAIVNAGIHSGWQPLSMQSHRWGKGQKLVPGDVEESSSSEDEEEHSEEDSGDEELFMPGLPQLPFIPGNRQGAVFVPQYHWPDQGNRLREGAEGGAGQGRELPVAAAQAAVERLQRAELQEDPQSSSGQPSPPKRPFRTPSVPSLCCMSTRATAALMTTPSMQYTSSLACLTPELAEHMLAHMARERLLRPRTLELFFGCQVQKFVLNCYPYTTNELLRQLRAFQTLKHLSLVSSSLITDSGLTVLASLQKLQHLNLAACSKLTDNCLQYIKGLKSLSFLSLDQTKVSDAGMVIFLESAPSSLIQLSLNQTGITEKTLAMLPSSVPQLKLLSIKQTKICDVSTLKELRCLHTLHLDSTCVSENSLQHLAAHPALSSLSLAGIPVANGNKVLQIISGLRLNHLTLPGRQSVTDSGLEFLSQLVLLTELDLTDYTQVTNQGVCHLAGMSRLKKLSLSNTLVTDEGLVSLQSLQELVELCLDRTTVTSKGVARCVTCLPHLQVLGLASTQVGDNVVRLGLVHCKQLLKINLSRTRITDKGLKYLRPMRLNQVNLDNTGVTLSGIANLISSCPDIINIRASNLRALPHDEVSDEEAAS
ncbi:uncharacterized protein si:ch73-173p19.1 [Polyodon spathula]|uniref:uncharacterized protein si:ch73-173p19.1 n=1 Tax=Polyodon spathula TaxID=7913 RepID=UPI001B7DDC66|nr:uncharacterized protein si:ch73-173p19.1 [Polyodon spathula]